MHVYLAVVTGSGEGDSVFGGGVGRERVEDLLPLQAGSGLLEHAEGAERPGDAGIAHNLVDEELAVGGLDGPGLAAVFTHQEADVGGDPAALLAVEADGGQPGRGRRLAGFPGGAAILGGEELAGEADDPAVLRVGEGDAN